MKTKFVVIALMLLGINVVGDFIFNLHANRVFQTPTGPISNGQ
ncbi:hypothetical protein SAMN03080598_01568 [Algoriphagus boritolerans DSM 17298 = JCM 18970]|uniref:Uncharacterized protein n=1 Tax=Algoriphagus boritolerans DSM 17298 = JCM 18970 TaxID=1120964 RepID=A0A1H5V7R8_9BACT|nr:hypothetical protein SAMN03080598_01568 [Algoriphagus boritolerans DSM 17298 = JCM 18970]